MLLPRTLLDAGRLLCAPLMLPLNLLLLSMLWLLLSVLLLLRVLLFLLVGTFLLLSILLLRGALLLPSTLLLLLPLPGLALLLRMLWRGFPFLVLALLLFTLAVLLLLRVGRSSDSQKQGQNGCADDSNYFHKCSLCYCQVKTPLL
jgi:hypothetical protein